MSEVTLKLLYGFSGYFFLSYLDSKTLYIWAHGSPLYIKYMSSLAICQGFSEKKSGRFYNHRNNNSERGAVFQAIFFSLILTQKPYIYGRTDPHYT
ncbi:MAG: hypothetical protein EWV77_04425 [Microcystis viridis Mv_BB_P_19951000_S68D]|uniref:Uncharacterized protein n=1 Tax=Microcystis viridis Mv_BB_P_19951000_S68D TaxID=2486270 RepID=A0A552I4M6_MICVR|nr:MAG: hypothetical protein EWV77_04425 [Microcystis viridis Mv_BB_P_19951000_S68D]